MNRRFFAPLVFFALLTAAANLKAQIQGCSSDVCAETIATIDTDTFPGEIVGLTTVIVDYTTAAYYTVCANVAVLLIDGTPPYGYSVVSPSGVPICGGPGEPSVTTSGYSLVPAYPGEYVAIGSGELNIFYTYDGMAPDCSIYCSGYWYDGLSYGLISVSNPAPTGPPDPYAYTFPFAPQPRASATQQVSLNGALDAKNIPMPSIVVTSNGTQQILSGGVALIDATPAFPALSAVLSPPLNNNLSVTWRLKLAWTRTQGGYRRSTGQSDNINCDPNRSLKLVPIPPVPWVDTPDINVDSTISGSLSFDLKAAISQVRGGDVTLTFTAGKQTSQAFTFHVYGANPGATTVRARIGQNPWYMTMIANHESNFLQFNVNGDYTPNWGWPCGFGILQRDPPPDPSIVWNWQANVDSGVSLAQGYLASARANWAIQVGNFNSAHAQNPKLQPPCEETVGAHCAFYYADVPAVTQTGNNFRATWSDATGIKFYNFGPTGQRYYRWVTGTTAKPGQWVKVPSGYVKNVCNKDP